jgi:hypothetical protein
MNRTGVLLLAMVVAGPAYGQPAAPPPNVLACGALKAEASKTGATSQWSIATPAEKTTETGTLRSGPRFECLQGAVLVVEFTSSAGHSVFQTYFPDGLSISYGRQQVDHRGNRFVLPIQAKARIPAAYRGAFDYHCKLNMPADPIQPDTRADCLF